MDKTKNPNAYEDGSTGGKNMFFLENGLDELSRWFAKVTLNRYYDALCVTEAEPLVAYVSSTKRLDNDQMKRFTIFVEKEIAKHGKIRITKDPGLFEALSN